MNLDSMAHAVFTIKTGSGYDDVPEERYHFPAQYLARVKQSEGDLVVYYEPRRGRGRLAYIAVAKVDRVEPDPQRSDHYYARVSEYLTFDEPVSFRLGDQPVESGLRSEGTTGLSGEFRNAVRLIPQHEFDLILAAGFRATSSSLIAGQDNTSTNELAEEPMEFERPMSEQVVRKAFRDAAFARQVKAAYAGTCALTGLNMRNGGGRTEVDAAHIKPVGDGHKGTDSVRNGMALSKTVHWMFDKGLLSIDADHRILTAGSLVPEPIRRLLSPSGYAFIPDAASLRPHPAFLEYHRNKIFKDSKAGG